MIPLRLKLFLICALAIYFYILVVFLKNKTLELRYTLLWLVAGVVLMILVIWPQLLNSWIDLVGIQSTMNGLFIMIIAFAIIIMMSLTSIVSKQANKIKVLVQELSIMNEKIREIQEKGEQ